MSAQPTVGYIDLYLLPVPKDNLEAYKAQAISFGEIALKHGALSYREYSADDLAAEGSVSFTSAVPAKAGEVLTTAVVEFTDRAHRDETMAKVMADPGVKQMETEELAEMNRMVYGGFSVLVSPQA